MTDIKKHKRVNDIFLAPLERPALQWLAAHMPAWVTPDVLTGIGLFGSVVIFVAYCLTNLHPGFLWLASLGFVINWFGDSLDGTLARYRHIERPIYGFFIDHTLDAFSEVLVFLGLGFSPYVRFDLACLALIGYLLASVLVYIRTCVKGEFKISYAGLGPTEARLIAIVANTVVFIIGNPKIALFSLSLSVYDWVAIVVAAVLFLIFVLSTIKQGRILAKAGQ
ncbi:MAG: CDP-alcohol phosphatidyltransferase family protein [Anaerolineales bacterium]|nr:CDP-alcohol phosphatidyltransferase family protein [Anaerolineales bacterium]